MNLVRNYSIYLNLQNVIKIITKFYLIVIITLQFRIKNLKKNWNLNLLIRMKNVGNPDIG